MTAAGDEPMVIAEIVDGVGRLTLNRPAKHNAINGAMADQFCLATDWLAAEKVNVVILRAAGPTFSAGADLREPVPVPLEGPLERMLGAITRGEALWIAEVQGPALGGGVALLAACPFAIAAQDCWFRLPEWELGYFPGGVVAYLEQIVPFRNLMTFACQQEQWSAATALASGLLSRIVAPASLGDAVTTLAQSLRSQTATQAAAAWNQRFRSAAFMERKALLYQ